MGRLAGGPSNRALYGMRARGRNEEIGAAAARRLEDDSMDVEVRSEPRGFHWIAWLVRPGETRPIDETLVVGQTQEEAEQRARERAAAPSRG